MVGCSNESEDGTVTYMEAKEKIINEGAILVDVRNENEYNLDHINGAILLPLGDITEDSVEAIVDSKDSAIIVYCQSGNRSSQAVSLLNNLGYTKVYDLGAMSNWKD
jgi:rhodanese-related sulfurtransferase